jgi:hypothetical protein
VKSIIHIGLVAAQMGVAQAVASECSALHSFGRRAAFSSVGGK